MDNILNDMKNVIDKNRKAAEYAQQQLDELKVQLDIPWEHERELIEKAAQLEKLDIELSQDMSIKKDQTPTDSPEDNIDYDIAEEEPVMEMV